jgi:peroxidase
MNPSQQCIKFTRSTPSYQNLDCSSQTHREQLNMATAYLDLSHVYGISLDESNSLRTLSNGQMKTSDGVLPERPYLPKASSSTCGTDSASNKPLNCFDGGSSDTRLNSNMPLTIIHTLFLRQHNRIAANLALVNPQWNDQRLFDETRRILIATYQHMVYNEWVAATSGRFSKVYPQSKNYGTTYNSTVNNFIND